MHRLLLATLALLACAGCGYIPFSSGPLYGTPTPTPSDWSDVANANIVELETNPADPYSVKLWIVGTGPNLYVHAGDNRAQWVEHMDQDPRVRLLIDQALYELSGSRVTSPDEFKSFADQYEIKYGRRPGNENVTEAFLYRLEARTPI